MSIEERNGSYSGDFVTQIDEIKTSINENFRLLEEDIRRMIREELPEMIKSEIKKQLKHLLKVAQDSL
jgi:hypothetical protein